MKFKVILLLAVLLLFLSHPALCGQGCGSNWLGPDVNDQDFYVSKNQNLGASSGLETPAASTGNANQQSIAGQPVKIGQSAKDDSAAIIQRLASDKPSPQVAGTAITWTAASDQKGLLFKFLLKGPSTNYQFVEKTNWTANNIWIWNTTSSDIGDSQIEVRARDGKHAGPESFDDSIDASFTIEVLNSGDADTTSSLYDANGHPLSHTANIDDFKTGPRTPPDERHLSPLSAGNPNGPNMSMPDPNPKPLGSTTSTTSANDASADKSSGSNGGSLNSEAQPSEPADVSGKWLVQLDKSGESMDLILIQTGASIMGSGNLDGETKIPLIASGSIDGDNLKLNVKTVIGKYVNQIDKHYEMDLNLADGVLSGSYQAYSGETSAGKGHVAATRPGT